jgi:hypothetical protein
LLKWPLGSEWAVVVADTRLLSVEERGLIFAGGETRRRDEAGTAVSEDGGGLEEQREKRGRECL